MLPGRIIPPSADPDRGRVMTVKNLNISTAEELINEKGWLIKDLIDQYFDRDPWDEDHLEEYANIEIAQDGTETIRIGDTELVRFFPIQCNYTIDDERVFITLDQPYEVLFDAKR